MDKPSPVPEFSLQAEIASAVDAQVLAVMRLMLGLVAVVIAYLDLGHTPGHEVVYGSLVAYLLYGLLLLSIQPGRAPALLRAQPWIDVLFYAWLVALTQGTGSLFFLFFLFAIVVAAFTSGFREGIAVTVGAVAAFAGLNSWSYVSGTEPLVSRTLSGSLSLFVVGYLLSYWGESELALRRRLAFLRELSSIADARPQLETSVAQLLARVLAFFGAQSCLLVVPRPESHAFALYRLNAARTVPMVSPDEVSAELGSHLVRLPPALRATCDARPLWPLRATPKVLAWTPGEGRCDKTSVEHCVELADLLETPSFATVPYRQSDGIVGRLYIMSATRRFDIPDTEFLAQAATQIGTVVNNLVMLEDLTRNAAQQERSRISRDIHDTTVQSYIGLKLGLEALYRDIGPGAPGAPRIKELLDMATLTVDDLRGYVDRLRGRTASRADKELVAQLEEQRRRYRDYHGIEVDLRTGEGLEVSDRIAGEAYRVVCEALSNVFRHTSAKHAFVDLRCEGRALAIEIGNDTSRDAPTPSFMPRSIAERAMSLGGKVQVRINNEGHDVVRVTVPLDGGLCAP